MAVSWTNEQNESDGTGRDGKILVVGHKSSDGHLGAIAVDSTKTADKLESEMSEWHY